MTIGSGDPPLSPDGTAQARALAARLAGRPLGRILASDQLRAVATAEIIAKDHGLDVDTDRRLRELDFGEWEGRHLPDLWATDPDAACRWEDDFWATPASFGESLRELEARVKEFWANTRIDDEGEVVVVAHRGSLAVLRALITGGTVESAFAAGIEVGTAIWLEGGR